MMKIYTPKAWSGVFRGAASLVIDDDGYIYDGDHCGFGASSIGRIDYDRNEIYGNDYGSLIRTPIAYMLREGDHLEIYASDNGLGRDAILYIRDDMIYTPQEWSKLFGSPVGIIENKAKDAAGKVAKGAAAASAASGWWIVLFVILLFSGGISRFIVTSPELFTVVVVGIIVLCCSRSKKKKAKAAK